MGRKKPKRVPFGILLLVVLVVLAVCTALVGFRKEASKQTTASPPTDLTAPEPKDELPGTPIDAHARSLRTPQDLLDLADWVNSGADDAGYSWYLENDVDMKGHSWTPIGGYSGKGSNEPAFVEHFDGAFYGQGHTVSNISCLRDGFYGVGFFGSIGPDALVVELKVHGSFAGEGPVGGIAGTSSPSNRGTVIAGCSFSGDVYTMDSYAGGIVGFAGSRTVLTRCFSNANVYGRSAIGGLVGVANEDSQIRDSSCVGTVTAHAPADILKKTKLQPSLYPAEHYERLTAASDLGGLVGVTHDMFLLKNCVANVKVDSAIPAEAVGNLVGSYSGLLNLCNFCAVEGSDPRTDRFYEHGSDSLWVCEVNKADMAKTSTFESFDFSTDWKISPEYNIPIPLYTEAALRDLSAEAQFRLGMNGESKSMHKGDTLGAWTMTALDFSTDQSGKVESLDSMFRGSATVQGSIERNPLSSEESYIVTVQGDEMEKLPLYLYEGRGVQDDVSFGMKIPQGLENTPKLEYGESIPAQITIRSYCHIFAYAMAMDIADVEKIVPLSE